MIAGLFYLVQVSLLNLPALLSAEVVSLMLGDTARHGVYAATAVSQFLTKQTASLHAALLHSGRLAPHPVAMAACILQNRRAQRSGLLKCADKRSVTASAIGWRQHNCTHRCPELWLRNYEIF